MRHRLPRRTRAHLDNLIDGRPMASDPLADLVAAVRAPAQPRELAGLDAALAEFAAVPSAVASPEERTPMLKSVAGRLLALKLLAVAAGTAAAGGVAFAAVNGPLDHNTPAAISDESSGAADSSGDSSAPGSSDDSDDPTSGSSSTSPSDSGSGSGTSASETGKPSKSSTPSPSLVGLCHAWLAHPRDIAKVSKNPAFSVLIKAAGGPDAVNGYCTTVLASAHPTHPAHPTKSASSAPSTTGSATPTPKNTHTKKPMPPQAQNNKPKPPKPH